MEIARKYLAEIGTNYSEDDVLNIAKLQIKKELELLNSSSEFIFFDTDLIIIKIWLLEVYKKYPIWIDEHLQTYPADLHLLCKPDLPWYEDSLRENPNKREYLFALYKNEIEKFGMKYAIIENNGDKRFLSAIKEMEFLIGSI